jgi:hypothetical protein
MDIYPHLPPPTDNSIGRRLSKRARLVIGAVVVAAVVALFRAGGLLVIAYFGGLLLLLIGIAYAVSKLRAAWAEGLFFLTLGTVGLGALATRHKVRNFLGNVLAHTDPATGQLIPRDQADIDAALLFLSGLVLSVVLGTALGWGLATVKE